MNEIASVLQAAALLLTVTSILWGVRVYRRQMNAQLFLEFTRRYDEVMRTYPEDTRSARLDSSQAPSSQSDELTAAVLRYLNLCSEEFYLRQRRYLAKDIWTIWEAEIQRTLQSPLEPPRESRRLQLVRKWSHEQVEEVFT